MAGEALERGQTVVRAPGDRFLARLSRQLDRLLAVMTRDVRWTDERVQEEQGAVHSREQRWIANALGDVEGGPYLQRGVFGPANGLEAASLREPQLGGDRLVVRAVDRREAGVEVRECLVVAPDPVACEPHATLDSSHAHVLMTLHCLAARPLPKCHGRVVLAEPLTRLREVLDQSLGIDVAIEITGSPELLERCVQV